MYFVLIEVIVDAIPPASIHPRTSGTRQATFVGDMKILLVPRTLLPASADRRSAKLLGETKK